MLSWRHSQLIPILCTLWLALRTSAYSPEWRKVMKQVLETDRRFPPDYTKENHQAVVTIQISVLDIDFLGDSTTDYSLSIILRQKWIDDRLVYDKLPGFDKLELDASNSKSIWVPDLYFVNEKSGMLHDVTTPNILMYIYPNGEVYYSIRLSIVLNCNMNLVKYPFDVQKCPLFLESFSYSTEYIVFRWHDEPIITDIDLKPRQFQFVGGKHRDCTRKRKGYINETFTCIRVDFEVAREYGYHITQVYLPSLLIVTLSWVSFWLDIDSVAARISLGILTVLTTATQSSNTSLHLPAVNYIKAIDLWMATCMLFVFSALIEFAYVNVYARDPIDMLLRSQWLDTVDAPTESFFYGGLKKQYVDESTRTGRESLNKQYVEESTSTGSEDLNKQYVEESTSTDPEGLNRQEGEESNRSEVVESTVDRAESGNGRTTTFVTEYNPTPKQVTAGGKVRKILKSMSLGRGRRRAQQIDRYSRVVFPTAFIAFNIFYWTYYLL